MSLPFNFKTKAMVKMKVDRQDPLSLLSISYIFLAMHKATDGLYH